VQPDEATIQKWINPDSGKTIFTRCTQDNLEQRTVAAAELYNVRYFKTITAAAKMLQVPYKRLWSRLQGCHSVKQNGGNRALLSQEEEDEVVMWAHRRIVQGHHLRGRTLQQHANAILAARGSNEKASKRWASRFIQRNSHIFRRSRTATRDARRKAAANRADLESFNAAWRKFLMESGIKEENTWNCDEIGFMVGYLQRGGFVWTFNEIEKPELTDSHDLVSVTAVEAVSATGKSIPTFLIILGTNIPVYFIQNDLEDNTVITISEKGYITDIIAIGWIKHFELHIRPDNPIEKRVLLLDSCESHFTEELVYFCF
jgi:hypothetical protein